MKIDIIGAGSLGLLLAGKLARAGIEIRIWCRSIQQSRELSRNGITISYEDGRESLKVAANQLQALPIKDFSDRYSIDPAEWLMVTVKQQVLHNDLKMLLAQLAEQRPRIICFQNGSGHMEMLKKLLPDASLYAAVTTEAAKVISPSEVIHAGTGTTWIGKWNTSKNVLEESVGQAMETELCGDRVVRNLRLAGFSALMSNEVETMIYRKLLMNAVINPLTAIWRIPNGGLLSTTMRKKAMRELYDEAIAVYDACGITYDLHTWDQILEVCQATSLNISSMLSDVLAARTTEISWINGSIVEMAERSGIEVPAHRWVCELVKGMIAEEG